MPAQGGGSSRLPKIGWWPSWLPPYVPSGGGKPPEPEPEPKPEPEQQPVGWWPSWLPPDIPGGGETPPSQQPVPEDSQPSYVPGGGRPGSPQQNRDRKKEQAPAQDVGEDPGASVLQDIEWSQDIEATEPFAFTRAEGGIIDMPALNWVNESWTWRHADRIVHDLLGIKRFATMVDGNVKHDTDGTDDDPESFQIRGAALLDLPLGLLAESAEHLDGFPAKAIRGISKYGGVGTVVAIREGGHHVLQGDLWEAFKVGLVHIPSVIVGGAATLGGGPGAGVLASAGTSLTIETVLYLIENINLGYVGTSFDGMVAHKKMEHYLEASFPELLNPPFRSEKDAITAMTYEYTDSYRRGIHDATEILSNYGILNQLATVSALKHMTESVPEEYLENFDWDSFSRKAGLRFKVDQAFVSEVDMGSYVEEQITMTSQSLSLEGKYRESFEAELAFELFVRYAQNQHVDLNNVADDRLLPHLVDAMTRRDVLLPNEVMAVMLLDGDYTYRDQLPSAFLPDQYRNDSGFPNEKRISSLYDMLSKGPELPTSDFQTLVMEDHPIARWSNAYLDSQSETVFTHLQNGIKEGIPKEELVQQVIDRSMDSYEGTGFSILEDSGVFNRTYQDLSVQEILDIVFRHYPDLSRRP